MKFLTSFFSRFLSKEVANATRPTIRPHVSWSRKTSVSIFWKCKTLKSWCLVHLFWKRSVFVVSPPAIGYRRTNEKKVEGSEKFASKGKNPKTKAKTRDLLLASNKLKFQSSPTLTSLYSIWIRLKSKEKKTGRIFISSRIVQRVPLLGGCIALRRREACNYNVTAS